MPIARVSKSKEIKAGPASVYAIIADYHKGHREILPKGVFSDLQVLHGGVGAGTAIRFTMRVLGVKRTLHAEITEPEPGRTLVENIQETGGITTFRVDPLEGGDRCEVTITSEWNVRGLSGRIEALLVRPVLARLFTEELQKLAERATRTG